MCQLRRTNTYRGTTCLLARMIPGCAYTSSGGILARTHFVYFTIPVLPLGKKIHQHIYHFGKRNLYFGLHVMRLRLLVTSISLLHLVIVKALLILSFIATSSVHAMAEPKKIPTLKLHYGDMNFWRAECVRMAFYLGEIPFEDVRHTDFKELKESGKLTFGAFPVLEVGDDGKILSQTQAIAVYAAKLAGIHPTEDDWLSAKIDECLNGCTDVTGTIGTTFRMKDEEKITTRKALIDKSSSPPGRLWMHLNGLEKICTENGCDKGYSVGSSLTVADLAIWRVMGWMDCGNLDGIPVNWGTSTFPALAKLVAAVNANPKVQEWKSKHPKFYDKK